MSTSVSPSFASTGAQARARAPLRFLTSTATFDGHDVTVNALRRLLHAAGAEVIHLGHNRSVDGIVRAALQEDVQAVAVSSYQGGHIEFFRYLIERLRVCGADATRVFGGGGGTITPEEGRELERCGVERIYTPQHGAAQGLSGVVSDMLERTARAAGAPCPPPPRNPADEWAIGRWLSRIERGEASPEFDGPGCPVVGVTGTGGAGKSTLIDEIIGAMLRDDPQVRVALLALDPTRHRTGGALLGDRVRVNSTDSERVFMRSMATRRAHLATNEALANCVGFLRRAGFDLVVVETAGIGQSDVEIVEPVDLSVYVTTSDFGAPMQMEKIQMLDFADLVVLNKADQPGADDALRALRTHWQRTRATAADGTVPVFATAASRFNDTGLREAFEALCTRLAGLDAPRRPRWEALARTQGNEPVPGVPIPGGRGDYLRALSRNGRAVVESVERQARAAAEAQAHHLSLQTLGDDALPPPLEPCGGQPAAATADDGRTQLRQAYNAALDTLDASTRRLLRDWPARRAALAAEQLEYRTRQRTVTVPGHTPSLAGTRVPRIAAPAYTDWGTLTRFLLKENLPGEYPYTAGVFAVRGGEQPTRMFAGEGTPERTNRRFHYLAGGQPAIRLSTAFDPIALYGEDPDERPDVFGRIGMSGVSVATQDDFKKLYSGFDLSARNTSVSMTVNGPAPVMLAWYLNTAVDQQVERHLRETGRWAQARRTIDRLFAGGERPRYLGELPPGNDGLGLGLLGVSGVDLVDAESYGRIREDTLRTLRGTLQADILKEDQAQNECLFPLEFALRLMADVQAFCIDNRMRSYYTVSVSGYHIAEAGANPVTQLAFTLANAFTLVECFRARGMAVDDFAPHLSFFFSNGMDAEYAVIGRVARRVWARAMHGVYGATERSQKLKYHIQTSGRSLQAQDIQLNDIRTTLQALYASLDNCNSLHTNAYDEAITTPTGESVRRALAIQHIIAREFGISVNDNPLQGSYLIEALTDRVEEAVYAEFDRLAERGGVLGAMEALYQRSKIQEESLLYERRKEDGSLPIVGVNTFVAEADAAGAPDASALTRSSEAERRAQLEAVALFRRNHAGERDAALEALQHTVRSGGNVFETLCDTVRSCTLGEITHALYRTAGRYRRRL